MATDTRPPLRLTASEAANWTRFHPEDHGRAVIVVEVPIHDLTPDEIAGWGTIRSALGHNARGEWVWIGEEEGKWP